MKGLLQTLGTSKRYRYISILLLLYIYIPLCCNPHSYDTVQHTSLLLLSESFIIIPDTFIHIHRYFQASRITTICLSKVYSSVITSYQIIHEHNRALSVFTVQLLSFIKLCMINSMIRKGMRGNLSVWQEHMKAKWLQDVSLLAPWIFI